MPNPDASQSDKSKFPVWIVVFLLAIPVGIAVLGIVAALGIYGVRKYLSAAKSSEAKFETARIAKDAMAAFEKEIELPDGTAGHRLCPSATKSVPPSLADVGGKKYMSSPAEWTADGPDAGFGCLQYSTSVPQYYMYSYEATGTGAVGDRFTARANGDLDGDGISSTFELSGTVKEGDVIAVMPTLKETMPEE